MAIHSIEFNATDILSDMSTEELEHQFNYWSKLFDEYADIVEGEEFSKIDPYKLHDIANFFRSIESVK